MKPLTKEGMFELDLADKLGTKAYAFTPVVREGCIGLGIAVANEPGYLPVPLLFCNAERYDEMAEHAEQLNRDELGLDDNAAAKIVCSSMFAKKVAA